LPCRIGAAALCPRRQGGDQRPVERRGIGLGDVVEAVAGRDLQSGALRADLGGDRGGDLDDQPDPVLDAAAVAVLALVGARRQELVQQVAVGGVDLDPAAAVKSATVRRASSVLRARGSGISTMPSAVKICPCGARADGATGWRPCGVLAGCATRPACMSWITIRPPAACTASVTRRQPATCASVWIPGVSR
jgi:hypothetical protein